MKKRVLAVGMSIVLAAFTFTACGGQTETPEAAVEESTADSASVEETKEPEEAVAETTEEPEETPEAAEETTAPEETPETQEETTAPEETPAAESGEETTSSSSGAAEETGEKSPYAWLGLQDMPQCTYLDILATGHYIQTYNSYVMGFVSEETEAVDGINRVVLSEDSRSYSVDGKVISITEGAKMYSEYDMGDMFETAKENQKNMKESGINTSGITFVSEGAGAVPLYSESGDTEEYTYYEYNYPDMEASGTAMTERYYMKDGDIFAIYQSIGSGESALETTKVIKSISGEIPEGTFDLPDLTGYTKIE